ncbi:hypothetical protein NPIL_215831 [Nephila pilipes]|uniref:Uncharacterized protein n=1 Tax=Nephila pilipes TaxID=299642 RepID=A0A8X6TI02_NEPPI|nr:hypothetical protein NPIL_215831 [Nephila pilipes]
MEWRHAITFKQDTSGGGEYPRTLLNKWIVSSVPSSEKNEDMKLMSGMGAIVAINYPKSTMKRQMKSPKKDIFKKDRSVLFESDSHTWNSRNQLPLGYE